MSVAVCFCIGHCYFLLVVVIIAVVAVVVAVEQAVTIEGALFVWQAQMRSLRPSCISLCIADLTGQQIKASSHYTYPRCTARHNLCNCTAAVSDSVPFV